MAQAPHSPSRTAPIDITTVHGSGRPRTSSFSSLSEMASLFLGRREIENLPPSPVPKPSSQSEADLLSSSSPTALSSSPLVSALFNRRRSVTVSSPGYSPAGRSGMRKRAASTSEEDVFCVLSASGM